MRTATVAACVVAALATSSGAVACGYTIVFGRTGGNIAASSITIGADGSVTAQGTMRRLVETNTVPPAALARIDGLIVRERFFALPRLIRCPGGLPDFAADFITVRGHGRQKTTVVRGDCDVRRFQTLYGALRTVVGKHWK